MSRNTIISGTESMGPLLSILSVAVLRSAWIEHDALVRGAMWQPLLSFLRGKASLKGSYMFCSNVCLVVDFPSAWEIEAASVLHIAKEPDDANSESEDDAKEGIEPREAKQSPAMVKSSPAYREFLRFLELGCSGSPLQGYPTVVVIISTLPPAVCTSVFWPYDLFTLINLVFLDNSFYFTDAAHRCLYFFLGRRRRPCLERPRTHKPRCSIPLFFA
jgi:hypothetical protein